VICLDTNVAIAIMNGGAAARTKLMAAVERAETIGISAIVLFELVYGAEHSAARERNLRTIDSLLTGGLEVLPLDADDAREAGLLREELARIGSPIGPYDLLIAAQVRRRGLTVATENVREFRRVAGLKLVSWVR
jgi:tRNA(fMet)-specific endonuclease VapC